mgnify:CR=1 FL=1
MSWITIPANPNWEYDTTPPDPGAALSTHWAKSVNGIRTTTAGAEIYVNCRHKPLNPTQSSIPNEISKTFWDVVFDRDGNYVQAGRVMDFADVGAFTLVDKSPEKNTAYLYTGRYASTNGSSDSIQFGQITLSEPVLQVRATVRSSSSTSVNLGVATGTLTANSTWQEIGANTPVADYGDAQWFNGTNTKVTVGAPISDVGAIEVKFIFSDIEGVVFLSQQNGAALYGLSITESRTVGNVHIAFHKGSSAFEFISQSGFSAGELITATAFYNFTTSTFSINVNGGTGDGILPGRHSAAGTLNLFQIGANGNDTFFTNGIISDLKEYDTDQVTAIRHWTALGATPWKDTIGTNDGAPSGTFQTVTEYFTSPNYTLGALFAGDISDVRLYGAAGKLLHRAQLNDFSVGNLDTMPVLDSSGNGKNGVYSGCAGATGEGIDRSVAGIVGLDDARWFNGTSTKVALDSEVSMAGDFTVSGSFMLSGDLSGTRPLVGVTAGDNRVGITITTGEVFIQIAGNVYPFTSLIVPANDNTLRTFSVTRVGTTTTIIISGIGTQAVTTSADTFLVGLIGRNGAGSQVWEGIVYNININSQAAYTGLGTSVTAWEDTIGSNDGTESGTFASVGQKRATIPQTADKNWNKYPWFNGTDTYVETTGMTATVNYFGACTISASVYIADTAVTQYIWALGAFSYRLSGVSGSWRVNGEDTGVAMAFGFSDVSVSYASNGNAIAFSVGGIELWTGNKNGTDSGTSFYVGTRVLFGTPGGFGDGLIFNFAITGSSVKNFAYTGLGNDPWKDTIGTNDGTEAGAFIRELVTASDTNDQIDALGNAIVEPRLNNEQINLFGDGERTLTPDSASLDVTTTATWEIWGNFYGVYTTNPKVFSKYSFGSGDERSWQFLKNASGNAGDFDLVLGDASGLFAATVFWSGIPDAIGMLSFTFNAGALVGYFNGVSLGSPTIRSGTIPVSLFESTADVMIGTAPALVYFWDRKIGSAKIYNVAFTADEVLTNYETRKSLYGL